MTTAAANHFFFAQLQQQQLQQLQQQNAEAGYQFVQYSPRQYHDAGYVPHEYRALQLPFRHPHHPPPPSHAELQAQVQQHQQHQLHQQTAGQHHASPLAAVGSSTADFPSHHYHHPLFPPTLSLRTRPQYSRPQLHHHHHHQPHAATLHPAAMAYSPPANAVSDEDMAAMQKLSNEYQAEVTGPLVGQREPSTAITAEYSAADPVYQAKTTTLPQKYSHYRKLRGDGKCGWRAVAFGYFETLIRYGNEHKFLVEEARLCSLTNIINNSNSGDPSLLEEFIEEALIVLRDVGNGMQKGNGDQVLLDAFNDEGVQNYVITYFKILTCAWMKTRPTEFSGFLDQTVEEYCDRTVMPLDSEIDHVSLNALRDVLLSSAGIQLEILYLDRTEGDEANMHRFDPVNPPGGIIIGAIRLLYRPGHYDMLYKSEDLPSSLNTIQTMLQYSDRIHNHPVHDLGVSDFMSMIPGLSYADPSYGWMPSSSCGGSDFFSSPSASMPAPVASSQPQSRTQSIYSSASTTNMVAPPNEITQEMTIRSVPRSNLHPQADGPFRASMWEFTPGFATAASQTPFKTAIFRNSHFNTAHFNNPDFQPEEFKPEEEYDTKPWRHRSFG